MKDVSNKEIARVLSEMAALLEMNGVAFKPRAYDKAALEIEALGSEVSDIYKKGGAGALMDVPHVGQGIAEHIEGMLRTGTFKEYQRLKKKIPVDISAIMQVEGIGPKMVKTLWQKLRVKNLADLEKAAAAGKIRTLPHFGKKSEEKILKGITFLKSSGGRRVSGLLTHELDALEGMIQSFPGVKRALIAGSARRKKETVGDIDILAVASKPADAMDRFTKLPWVEHVYAKGPSKTLLRLKNGMDADLRIVPEHSWGAALVYFTGSKEHNIALREIAIKQGMKLNEYGLYKGTRWIAGKTEEELYKALGLAYIEPELRENRGEVEAALRQIQGKRPGLPKLIPYGSIKGDLQVQTDWTDGENSIEEMAIAAEKAGLEYIAITDHTRSLAMTGGADEKKLLKQILEIARINKKFQASSSKLRVLSGAEVNILRDGSLDIDSKTLAKLDVVGAAVHSHFNLSQVEQTKRIIRAMENPHVDIIFHLTGRIINKRGPIHLDMDEIITAAKRTHTILEVDAHPERLDIKDEYIRKCTEAGVKMTIDSDAHAAAHFGFLPIGIAQARRGWAGKSDIANAWPLEKFKKFLK